MISETFEYTYIRIFKDDNGHRLWKTSSITSARPKN